MSQAVWVKSDPQPLSDFHSDFGVWGIAREPINTPYILWERNSFMKVTKPDNSEVYVPDEDAYWLNGYEYTFIAVAPYTNSGVTPNFTLADDTATPPTKDALSFAYNLGQKYDLKTSSYLPKEHYEFDLMAAVAKPDKIGAVKPTSQELTFWHLLSQINIEVVFGNDTNGNPITGTVSQMRLLNVDKEANYIISFNNNNELAVSCQSNSNQQANLTFDAGTGSVNILPQDITDFELYIDFTINEGTVASPKIVSYNDFKVNLDIQNPTTNPTGTNPSVYNNNESYSWNIKIGPKQKVDFAIAISDWTEETVGGENVIL